MAMFPVLQWYYHNDPIMEEVIPQFAYSGEGKSDFEIKSVPDFISSLRSPDYCHPWYPYLLQVSTDHPVWN
jgi:hypothetical protein